MSDLTNKPVCYNCISGKTEEHYMFCEKHKESVLKNNTCNSFEEKQGEPNPKIWIYKEDKNS